MALHLKLIATIVVAFSLSLPAAATPAEEPLNESRLHELWSLSLAQVMASFQVTQAVSEALSQAHTPQGESLSEILLGLFTNLLGQDWLENDPTLSQESREHQDAIAEELFNLTAFHADQYHIFGDVSLTMTSLNSGLTIHGGIMPDRLFFALSSIVTAAKQMNNALQSLQGILPKANWPNVRYDYFLLFFIQEPTVMAAMNELHAYFVNENYQVEMSRQSHLPLRSLRPHQENMADIIATLLASFFSQNTFAAQSPFHFILSELLHRFSSRVDQAQANYYEHVLPLDHLLFPAEEQGEATGQEESTPPQLILIKLEENTTTEETCPICLEGEVDAQSVCGHFFHAGCLRLWYNAAPHQSCPTCRRPLVVSPDFAGNATHPSRHSSI